MKEKLNEYFHRSEFACKCGCGFRTVDNELLEVLWDIREHFKKPVIINSGCRCIFHNTRIKGSMRSKHVFACAADIEVIFTLPIEIYNYVDKHHPDEYGLGLHDDFLHLDIRSTKWREKYVD